MGLVTSLCSELSVSPALLARIVGLREEEVAAWESGGVPPHHQAHFRPLEELLESVAERAPLPLRAVLRLGLRELGGRSILEALEGQGPVAVQARLAGVSRLDPVWAAA